MPPSSRHACRRAFFGRHAAPHLLGGLQLDVRAKFRIQIPLELPLPKQDSPYVARKALAIASEIRSQRSDSVFSRFRPRLVRR